MKLIRAFLIVVSITFGSTLVAQTVYTTKTGEKYHTENCRYLKYSKKEIELKVAISNGYDPCLVCKPVKNNKSSNATSSSLKRNTNTNATTSKSAAKQCVGKTKSGSRCKRRTKNKNGRCYQH